ncbi:MAG: hypothetical protein QXN15_11940 [Candidatus Jordarchaeales archaeon]
MSDPDPLHLYLVKNLRGVLYFSKEATVEAELKWLKKKFKYRELGISDALKADIGWRKLLTLPRVVDDPPQRGSDADGPIYLDVLLAEIASILWEHGPFRQIPSLLKHIREGGNILDGLDKYGPIRHGLKALDEICEVMRRSLLRCNSLFQFFD